MKHIPLGKVPFLFLIKHVIVFFYLDIREENGQLLHLIGYVRCCVDEVEYGSGTEMSVLTIIKLLKHSFFNNY